MATPARWLPVQDPKAIQRLLIETSPGADAAGAFALLVSAVESEEAGRKSFPVRERIEIGANSFEHRLEGASFHKPVEVGG